MLDTIAAVILIALMCIIGIALLSKLALSFSGYPELEQGGKTILVIPFYGGEEDVENTLRRAHEFCCKKGCAFDIVAVDCGLDDESAGICRTMARDCENIKVKKAEELADYLKEKAAI